MATSQVIRWTNTGIKPAYNDSQARVENVKLPANVTYAAGTVLGELVGKDAVYSLAVSGSPTGGTFTITYGGQTSAAIAYNATALAVQQALEALSSIGVGGVLCSGGPLPGTAATITFSNQLGKQAITSPTHTDSFTGGSSPAAAFTSTTVGSSGTPGTFAACVYTNTDGSQVPKAVLQFACATDSSGNITFGGSPSGGEFGQTDLIAPAYFSGTFYTTDLVGMTEQLLSQLGGHYVSGSIANGGIVTF